MRTEDWLSQGNLQEAIIQARKDLLIHPKNTSLRFLLFELLVLTEDFDGASAEIQQIGSDDPSIAESVEFYLGLINAERVRYKFLTEIQGYPEAVLDPPKYGEKFIKALRFLCQSKIEEAQVVLSEGWSNVPKVFGSLNDKEFAEIRDADDILGPFLEMIVPGRYFWIPFEQMQLIEFKSQQSYLETIWMPVYLEMKGGVKGNLWVPSLYSGTGKKDDILKLGQLTVWEYPSASIARGYGQRDLKIDKILKGIRQVSIIRFK